MPNINKEVKFIRVLEKSGLNYNEALVYFSLIKLGQKGATVYELDHHFTPFLKRTTIYSILRKLIELGSVREGEQKQGSRKVTLFIANKPEEYYDKIILKKQKELDSLKKLKEKYLDYLSIIYQEGIEYNIEELDDFIQPYLKPLVKKGWIITSYLVKKEVPLFEYSVYDCMLKSPNAKYLKENSFHLFLFENDIEKDTTSLQFFIKGLRNKTHEIISYFSDIKRYKLDDKQLTFYNKTYPGFNLTVKLNDLKNSKFFDEVIDGIRSYWKKGDIGGHLANDSKELQEQISNQEKTLFSNDSIDIWKAVIIPIKNKLFFLWAESYEILNEMVEPIFIIEKIPFKS
ncbi:MAG: helix-turn-helix domain-containing protein [Candidatus Thorarchaeota archaeon]